MTLFEEGDGRADTLVEIFLVHEGPVGISSLLPDLDAFEDLLSVRFKRGKVIWSEHIGWTVKTRQFHELAHGFRRFQTGAQRHFDVLPVFTHPLWIKGIGVNHWKEPLSQRSEEHTSELQSQFHLVCRLLLEKKK